MAKPEEGQENQEEVVEATEEVQSEEQGTEEKKDRPEINYKKEIERRKASEAKLQAELETLRASAPKQRNENDLGTWSDHELKAVINSNDPQVVAYKDQASDLLLERKVMKLRERERAEEKRALSDIELRTQFPEALDSASEFALKMEHVMREYDLQKSPAGKLAAAKIVAAEMGKGRSNSSALDRQKESSRVNDVKRSMVDGDRSKPTDKVNPKKVEELEKRIQAGDHNAVGEALGLDANKFFGRK